MMQLIRFWDRRSIYDLISFTSLFVGQFAVYPYRCFIRKFIDVFKTRAVMRRNAMSVDPNGDDETLLRVSKQLTEM